MTDPARFPPQIFNSNTIPAVNSAIYAPTTTAVIAHVSHYHPLPRLLARNGARTWFENNGIPVRLYCTSSTWMLLRAAFVQMASDGKDSGDGLRGEGMNGRCTAICSW